MMLLINGITFFPYLSFKILVSKRPWIYIYIYIYIYNQFSKFKTAPIFNYWICKQHSQQCSNFLYESGGIEQHHFKLQGMRKCWNLTYLLETNESRSNELIYTTIASDTQI